MVDANCASIKGNKMKSIKVKLSGSSALLMHSDRFANPLDPLTKAHKELTGKRKKTDDDHIAIADKNFLNRSAFYYIDQH